MKKGPCGPGSCGNSQPGARAAVQVADSRQRVPPVFMSARPRSFSLDLAAGAIQRRTSVPSQLRMTGSVGRGTLSVAAFDGQMPSYPSIAI